MLPKNRAYGCSPCASVQLQFQTATVFRDRGFGIWVVLHAPRIRMMRGPAVAMPDLVLTDVGDQAGILLVLRQGDVANALAEPRAAFSGAVAGRDDLQPRQALLDNLAGIGMVVLHRWFEKYNHREMLLCCGSWNLGSLRHAIVRGTLLRGTCMGPCLGLGSRYGARVLSVCGILRRAALSLLSQLRRVDRRRRLAGAAAFSATLLLWLRAPVQSVHVPGGSLVSIAPWERLKARRQDP